MLKQGIYEQVVTKEIHNALTLLQQKGPDAYYISKEIIDVEEARKKLAAYIYEVTRKALHHVRDKDNGEDDSLALQVKLCNEIIDQLAAALPEEELEDLKIWEKGEILTSVYEKLNHPAGLGERKEIRPVTPISESSLFTGSHYEPNIMEELKKEILSSDAIDWLVSFIKWNGLRCLMDELKTFTNRGGKLRVITTSYMEATDYKAVEALSKLPNSEIKVSYDTKRTRLHAKSYMFQRETGFSTVYIGSSNVSNPALTSGLEWNLKVTEKDSFDIIKKCEATFESYWNDNEFAHFDVEEDSHRQQLKEALSQSKRSEEAGWMTFLTITPYPYQKEILEELQAERDIHNCYRNLLVAATGVGKTVIAAFDYKRFYKQNPGANKLLFVAHREEILRQSMQTFRQILREPDFGDLHVAGKQAEQMDHLFISIQSFNSREMIKKTSSYYYDFIIVDEFHHAAVKTYQDLLNHYRPSILLGLTATPERMDGKNVLEYFDDRIASEMRLPEAIDRKLLSPFQYFAVSDTIDYSQLKWQRGGYDVAEMESVLIGDDIRVREILRSLDRYVTNIEEIIGLGFCVSIEHAKYMANKFNEAGIASKALYAQVEKEERRNVQKELLRGDIKFIFAVDLYNEGVDLPELNTVLFLRPTESLTVFLQQLGRGLRLADGKECLTVLDFVGQAHKNYNFEEKFRALIGKSKHSVKHYLENGFSKLPRGCYIQLEKQAKEYVLRNINTMARNRSSLINQMKFFEEDTGKSLSLKNFLHHYQLNMIDFYGGQGTKNRLFTRMKEEALSLPTRESDFEELMNHKKRISAFFHIDSASFLSFIKNALADTTLLHHKKYEKEVAMIYYSFFQKTPRKEGFESFCEGVEALFKDDLVSQEMNELVDALYEDVKIVEVDHGLGFECPLKVHARYSTSQILAAFGYYNNEKCPAFREGAKHFDNLQIDMFLITLNKSEKDFSPSTLYEDYAINETLFHWQTQSRTRSHHATAKRYVNHQEKGNHIVLFARESKKENGYPTAFVFLGKADYVEHSGEAPMSFVWRLKEEIPPYFLPKANKNIL
ncbi:Superfamily II DNA or RNA helicase [Tindallia magadiensis]|uniref:Superfamily II DNA or RNA helicase n=1 Tax=Tindallia magadiensis TaxID=69895 RepID=A0A1I3H388_9FIRM|nr:DUF3427 domain-containing protein [Tindallia magadiensis]SFI30136.1 Superfamily II DNA or RNA helicase [Tindallia magadiensis]